MGHIAIVGAGISGLASAWFLRKRGHSVSVLEGQAQVGGNIRTQSLDGYLVDSGPTSTLFRDGALGAIIAGLGVGDALVTADPAAARRYIVKDDALVPLPNGPLSFLTTPLFSTRAKLRMLLEPFRKRATMEETIAQFVRRRLGPEFLDWGIDPFISGVYAGDPEHLSVRAATGKVYALETEYRSLFVGAAVRWFRGRATGPAPTGRLVSFRSGMHTLPQALAANLGTAIRTRSIVSSLTPQPDGGWALHLDDDDELFADRLVLAIPAYSAARLLAPVHRELGERLADIRYAPVVTVALGFLREHVAHPLDGFGLLIPRRVGRQTLGALFSSTLFPGRAPAGCVLLTGFLGGARHPDVLDRTDSQLSVQVMEDLRALLGLRADPQFVHVTRWRHAIPQYEVGHLDRIKDIETHAARFPRLHFRASWRDGISISDCVANARTFAERIRAP